MKKETWLRLLTLTVVFLFFLISPPWGFSDNKSTDSKKAEVTKTVKKYLIPGQKLWLTIHLIKKPCPFTTQRKN